MLFPTMIAICCVFLFWWWANLKFVIPYTCCFFQLLFFLNFSHIHEKCKMKPFAKFLLRISIINISYHYSNFRIQIINRKKFKVLVLSTRSSNWGQMILFYSTNTITKRFWNSLEKTISKIDIILNILTIQI